MLALFVGVGVYAVSAGYESSGQQHSVNETFTPDAGNVTSLNQSDLSDVFYAESVTVTTNASGEGPSKLASPGRDYEWYPSNGTLKTLAGGKLDGVSSARILYGYTAPTPAQRGLVQLAAGELEMARLLALVGVVGAVVLAIGRLGQL